MFPAVVAIFTLSIDNVLGCSIATGLWEHGFEDFKVDLIFAESTLYLT